jgi:hypothetical protein
LLLSQLGSVAKVRARIESAGASPSDFVPRLGGRLLRGGLGNAMLDFRGPLDPAASGDTATAI